MSKALDRLTLLETFVRIAEAGSISAAARDLGVAQPSASRQLAQLETRLQTQLIRRNTHSLTLTEAGTELLADARELIGGWETLEEKHVGGDGRIEGRLKIVAPVALGQSALARIAGRFQRNHPAVQLNWQLEDRPIRFAEVGCDLWIKVGDVPDDRLVVRRLGAVERLLVASRVLVTKPLRNGTPQDVRHLPLIALEPFEGERIPLRRRGGRSTTLAPSVRMRTNNIFAVREYALDGVGMAVLPRWFVAAELAAGRLVDVLPQWRAMSLALHVAYLPATRQPLRLRAFLDRLEEEVPKIDGVMS